ncbi:MAG: FAD-dependent oxidoreductase [Sphingomonadales bacterium]|nr:MAG: FAD-dependent oxidoreductase [Sphingomonadales bacterium]TNF06319.1 MAG: FAD-dependent oxidoreductase [Sphingomonadales bacterium]
MEMQQEFPVIVAGGGPVGLATALDLQARGIRVLVIERNPTTTRHPKMDVTNGRSMEHFRRLGVAELIRDRAVPRENCMDVSWVTRLSEWELARFHYPNVYEWREHIRRHNDGTQPLEPNMRLSQVVLEPALVDLLQASPLAEVRFGWAFEDFVEDEQGVTVTALEVATGDRHQLRCQLLAGCDGGGSLVREKLGFELNGKFNVARVYMTHFRSSAKDFLQRFGVAWHYQTPDGTTLIAQDDEEIWTLHSLLPPDADDAAIDPKQIVYRALGREFPLEVLQANAWSPHLVVASGSGRGRVWLAGDAMHQLIPTGGYGMNTGIGEAADLAWKFAAVLQGWGGERLLQTIDTERRPIAQLMVDSSMQNMAVRLKIAECYTPEVHEDSDAGAAARSRLSKLIYDLGNAENESLGLELGCRYHGSPIICSEADEPEWERVRLVPTTWPGGRAPHVFLESGDAMFDLFGQGFTLVRFAELDVDGLLEAAAEHGVPIKLVDVRDANARTVYERDLVLVRPDHYVAWRGNEAPSDPFAIIDQIRGA